MSGMAAYQEYLAGMARDDGPRVRIHAGLAHLVFAVYRSTDGDMRGWYLACEGAGVKYMDLLGRPYKTLLPEDAGWADKPTCLLCLSGHESAGY